MKQLVRFVGCQQLAELGTFLSTNNPHFTFHRGIAASRVVFEICLETRFVLHQENTRNSNESGDAKRGEWFTLLLDAECKPDVKTVFFLHSATPEAFVVWIRLHYSDSSSPSRFLKSVPGFFEKNVNALCLKTELRHKFLLSGTASMLVCMLHLCHVSTLTVTNVCCRRVLLSAVDGFYSLPLKQRLKIQLSSAKHYNNLPNVTSDPSDNAPGKTHLCVLQLHDVLVVNVSLNFEPQPSPFLSLSLSHTLSASSSWHLHTTVSLLLFVKLPRLGKKPWKIFPCLGKEHCMGFPTWFKASVELRVS